MVPSLSSGSHRWHQVGLAEGTFYPAVHTVLGGWYTKRGDSTKPRYNPQNPTDRSQNWQKEPVFSSGLRSSAPCLAVTW